MRFVGFILMVNVKNHFMRNWKNYLIGFLVLIVLYSSLIGVVMRGSMNAFDSAKSLESAQYNRGSSNYYGGGSDVPEQEDRKVVKNANVDVESGNFDESKKQIEASIEAHDALVLSKRQSTYKDEYKRMYYTLKVEVEKLNIFLDEIKTYGDVNSFNVYVNDVTGAYVDYSNRLERYEGQIQRYESMLAKPNLEIEDEIDIQDRIDDLEDDIFSIKSRMANIEEDVDYSDVRITLREEESILSQVDFLGLKDGFSLFMQSLEAGIKFILVMVGFLLPFGLIYVLYRVIRRFSKN